MVSKTSKFVKLRQKLIDHKTFLLQLKNTESKKEKILLLKKTKGKQLSVLKDLVKNIVDKNIPISRETLKKLEHIGKIKYLLQKFKKNSDVYKNRKKLKTALIHLNDILPLFIESILK